MCRLTQHHISTRMCLCQHFMQKILQKMLSTRNMCVKMQVVIKMSTVIGTRIKESRKAAGYTTQGALATALRTHYGLKTDRPMVSKWESGRQVPEMYTIKCISELCSVSTDYLCGKEERPTPVSESGPASEISGLIDQLTPEQQRLILAQIKGILSSRE